MKGLIGLGIGLALGFSQFKGLSGQSPMIAWGLLGLSYVLVYLWGRRRRPEASATAVAIATAEATSNATAAVQVFIGAGAGSGRHVVDDLQGVAWRVDDSQISAERRAELAGGELPDDLVDLIGQADLDDVVRRGEIEHA